MVAEAPFAKSFDGAVEASSGGRMHYDSGWRLLPAAGRQCGSENLDFHMKNAIFHAAFLAVFDDF